MQPTLTPLAAPALPTFEATDAPEAVAGALAERGGAIVRAAAAASLLAQLEAELTPYLDAVAFSRGHFMGRRTKRTGRLIAKSRAARELVRHPLVLEVVERLLGPHCHNVQLHATMAIRIHPGETAQTLHRDDNVFPLRHPGAPISINAIWALQDFTRDNGATRVVPASHVWDDERVPMESEAAVVEMPRGSVVIFDNALYHGGGANRARTPRLAALFAYSQGWVRQLENQYLAVPPELARTLPRDLRELVGYRTHGFLGSFETGSPELALADDVPDVLPAEDLYTAELQARRLPRR
jgi:ectoine hydroxylase-related dioxygenase (phytanoyl-CoA dioxygenase family)